MLPAAAVLALGLIPLRSADGQAAADAPALRAAGQRTDGVVVEQRVPGRSPPARLVRSFDGLGAGFRGPHGTTPTRNPSDNSLAVGRRHVVQSVNSYLAIFDKRGRPLYGPVPTNTVFAGFGGPCEVKNNGDAVIRYDQLANRWLVVMPVFSRNPVRPDEPAVPAPGQVVSSVIGRPGQPGPARRLPDSVRSPSPRAAAPPDSGSYAMCYAVSTGDDPRGPYFRYEFVRPLFPDYPRPAVWPDGYYTPTSTGDEVIEKHVCVADRSSMLAGRPASEQCVVVPGANFLNTADLDGRQLPPPGAPNLVLAAGGTQLHGVFADSVLWLWRFHVDWSTPGRTRLVGPETIPVAAYRYLCDGQLTKCVPQPDTDVRLDAQGDKIMPRTVYRRRGSVQSIVAVHSVATAGGGGVRWYELRVAKGGDVTVHQQGTYAPDGRFRWMASPAIDRLGNIGIGYSFGGPTDYPGQRFAGRAVGDPKGLLTIREAVLVEGAGSQTGTLRWEDYTQTAVDPVDDCTIWYVGDYLRAGATSYSTRIGAFRLPGCR